MEKLEFGALLKTAFKRCVERQLSRLIAMQMLLPFLAALPLIVGMTVLVMMVSLKQYVFYGVSIITVLAAMVLYYLPCIYFICLVNYGLVREILYPEARIGRGLRSGFARWKVAFYPIPWFFAVVFIMAAWGLVQILLLRVLPSAAQLTQLVNTALNIEGFLFTMYDGRLRLHNQVVDDVKKHFPGMSFETVITRNVRLSEAPSYGKPAILYDASSSGANNYLALAQEIIKKNI